MKKFKDIDSLEDKTDPIDAINIAERLRFRQPKHPFNGNMKRALVLTARKLVRLIYALLLRGEIYQKAKVQAENLR